MPSSERAGDGGESDGHRDGALDDRELLVASNREPYSHDDDGSEVAVSRPAGGLTSALDPIVQELSGTWVAWGSGDADFDVADEGGRVEVPPEDPAYTLRRLHLSERKLDGYYYGYSNQVLWPVCHGMPSRANFDGEFWRAYRQVNGTFADALARAADGDDPVVWLQDYHLALAPRLVREQLPEAFLTQFWHVPWPSWETFRSIPRRRELLVGLLGNDRLGFHREEYGEAFCECVSEAFPGASVDAAASEVTHAGHTTQIRCYPLGVDADAFAERATTADAERFWSQFAADHDLGDRVVVGVDRLDYTKGILERLDALERLWERHPERRESVTYVQKASESRTRIEAYRTYQRRVESRVRELNDRFGTADWTPVVYVTDHYSQRALAALYRHADVALVSPVRDGMNLVAKEYVASQVDDGVLVLSEFAGAVDSLGDEALVVNPNDTGAFATAVEAALSMPERTRRRRTHALRRRVAEESNDAWVEAQLGEIPDAETGDADARTGGAGGRADVASRPLRRQSQPRSVWGWARWLADRIGAADGLFVMTDFDGTVADVVDDPERAALRADARDALATLAAHSRVRVAFVSGRSLDDLRERAAIGGAQYAGNHGLEVAGSDGDVVHPAGERARGVLEAVCAAVERRIAGVDGAFVEDKGPTASVHYRQAEVDAEWVAAAVREAVDDHDAGGALRVASGKQVVELRPDVDWGKGAAVESLRERATPDGEDWFTLYVGDDETDEAAFEALDDRGLGVAVGSSRMATAAPCVVNDPGEVADLFAWLADEGLAALEASRRGSASVESN